MLVQMCQEITSSLGGCFAEVWLPTVHNDKLQLYACHAATTAGQLFYESTSSINRIDLQEGLPGNIWTAQQSLLLNVTEEDLQFTRREAAMRAGIRWMAGIPLFFNKMLVGVLIVGTIRSKEETEKLLATLNRLDKFIGAKIYRKRMEQEFQRLFDSLPDLICTTDIMGRFLKINKAGAALLEYPEAELLGQPYDTFVSPADQEKVRQHVDQLIS